MAASRDTAWHQLQVEEVVRLLDVDLKEGLSAQEVRRRQELHGPNRMTPPRRAGAIKRFLLQFAGPLMYILVVAAVVTAFMGEYVDAAVIFGVVLINAMVGFIQESKAERAIEALSRMVVTEATVRRDGRKQRVPSESLTPGDVVLLQSGDRVPADLRLLHVRSLHVDESALTGESVPVQKRSDHVAMEAILAERANLAYAGTLVTYGQAEGVVWAIGNQTEAGRIATLIFEAVDISTPLTCKIAQFSKVLLWVIMGLAAATFGIGLWRGEGWFEMFMASVALAVGAIPEGLPAAVTITLAIGVARMARRRVIIRKLPAVETLGSTTVICTDKTGTLTQNQMTVQRIFAGGRRYELTGVGYEGKGQLLLDGRPVTVELNTALRECLTAGLLCNDSQLTREEGRLVVQGDPTEAALIIAAQNAGLKHPHEEGALRQVDMIPFESEHMFRATLHEALPQRVIYKVGAMEKLLERCSDALDESGNLVPLDKAVVRRVAEEMAADGLRVLAMVRRHTSAEHEKLEHEHVASGLTFLGLQAMMDPPRPEAIAAVSKCRSAGIAVKMITGDHVLTARAIARQIGLEGPIGGGDASAALPAAVSGVELEACSDEQLMDVAEHTNVFARVAPEQKFRLVKALQGRGHVVAMTGDGVNDAPALKQADIGIAMGIGGTEVAKSASDMVLTDDNFASIEAAVEEGRGTFDNLSKFIIWTLPTNIGESLFVLTAVLLGTALPALPVQLLWINMTTAILLGLMLVLEPKEADLMQRPPRDPRSPILTHPLFMRTGLVTLLMLTGGYFLFGYEQHVHGASLAEARTIVVNTIVLSEMFYLINCRSMIRSPWTIGFFTNVWIFAGIATMLAAQIFFTHTPVMNRWFHSAPIRWEAWCHAAAVGAAIFVIVEIEKWVRRWVERRIGH